MEGEMRHIESRVRGCSYSPARLSITKTAWLLGFTGHDITALISMKLLIPPSHPPLSGSKSFATVELQILRNDTRWLAKASAAIVNHWRKNNSSRRENDEKQMVKQLLRKIVREKSVSGRLTACRLVSATESRHAQPMPRPAHF